MSFTLTFITVRLVATVLTLLLNEMHATMQSIHGMTEQTTKD